MAKATDTGIKAHQLLRVEQGRQYLHKDALVVEEPLEIQLAWGSGSNRRRQSIAVTMRTPGHDFELAAGFLFTEGLISRWQDIAFIRYVQSEEEALGGSALAVELQPSVQVDAERLTRHFYVSSSCGVCGKASIESVYVHASFQLLPEAPVLRSEVLYRLPAALSQRQDVFSCTGGIHAAGLFNAQGDLLLLREDVGRHNAVDKLIGAALQQRLLPLHSHILLVSGRAGFELCQKALLAGIPVMAAVGAPSSLAVSLAEAHGMTLIGFLREERFNVYAGRQRLLP